MSSRKSELSPYQSLESSSLELNGQCCNGESDAVSSDAGPDPAWWTMNINTHLFPDEVVENQVYQNGRTMSAGVFLETPRAIEARTHSENAPLQTTGRSSGFYHQRFGLNVPVGPDIVSQPRPLSAYPDDTNSKVFPIPSLLVQSRWDQTTSPSALRSDHDPQHKTGRFFMPLSSETFYQGSQEKRKIPKIDPFACPHCCKIVSSKHKRSHIQKCQERVQHPNKCYACGKSFTRQQDVDRHRITSCQKGSAPNSWVCTCGKDYSRKDHGERHIKRVADNSKMRHTLQFRLA